MTEALPLGESRIDSFTFRSHDGQLESAQTTVVIISIAGNNDFPSLVSNLPPVPAATLDQDYSLNLSSLFTDPDRDAVITITTKAGACAAVDEANAAFRLH